MAEPRTRASRARSYLDMVGLGRPRRRPVVDIEVGEARMEPDVDVEIGQARMEPSPSFRDSLTSQDPEAIAGRTIAQLEAQAPTTQARADARRGELEADVDRERRRDAAYDRSIMEGLIMDSDNLEALRAGTVQGVTFGAADELAGAAVHPWDRQPQPRGFARPGHATYESERDRARAANETARSAAPRAYAGGEVLGASLPALLMPGSSARTVPGRVLQSAGYGGAYGGAQGFGHSRGDAGTQALDTLRGAGYGAAGGAIGQSVGELGAAGARWLRSAPEGSPMGGRDFTPEQQAQMDPATRMLAERRRLTEIQAASNRVRSASPNVTQAELDQIEATYEGGVRGLARDMDAAGIAPRRSFGTADVVQERAMAARPIAGVEPPTPTPTPPPPAMSGQFADDAVASIAPSGARPSGRHPMEGMAPDPYESYPFDPNDTLEMQMRREFEREGRSTGASTQAGTAPRQRVARAAREEVASDAFLDVTNPPVSPETQGLIDRARPAEPIDFAEGMAGDAGGSFDDAAQLRRQNNILSAERRARRGSTSRATHDDRTWPIRPADFVDAPPEGAPYDFRGRPRPEDVTPPAAPQEPARAPAEPPPLPRRPRPAQDVGRWDAPTAEPPQPPPAATPGQRASETLRPMVEREARAAGTRGEGPALQRLGRSVEDIAMRWLPRDSARAAVGEMRSDAIAADIMRRLGDTPSARALRTASERSPRAFGLALVTLSRQDPEVTRAAQAATEPASVRGARPTAFAGPIDPESGVPYADTYEEGEPPGDDDEDVDYGVPYADEYDEQGNLRPRTQR